MTLNHTTLATTTDYDHPLVSVLMLTYNRATYIETAIKSVIEQTYQNWELVIIDDGSTDTTPEIVARYTTDPRIVYKRDEVNRRLIVRRKESLAHARGTYVAVLDSDDMWIDARKLEKQVAHMEAHPECAVVGTFIALIDETGTTVGSNRYFTEDRNIRDHLLIRNQFAHSSVLMRGAHLKLSAGYRPFASAEDLELFLQLGQIGTLANLPEYMVAYRVHNGGESADKVKVAKHVLRLARLHHHLYPGYWRIVIKMNLLIILAKLGLK
jgi:glycosyltransferase involved in cell wall biosynthesis